MNRSDPGHRVDSTSLSEQDDQAILITGASGLIGQALLPELSDLSPLCLAHREAVPEGSAFSALRGDILQRDLGLPPDRISDVIARTRSIVHAAAITSHAETPERVWEVNVEGTKRVLDLAARASARVYYVGTAWVNRATAPRRHLRKSFQVYLESKLAADELVRRSGLPTVTIRPSIVTGDSRTGSAARHQGFHALLEGLCQGTTPLVPLSPESSVDFVPQDLVARAMAALVRAGSIGGEYWLTAGNAAVPSETLVDIVIDTMAEAGLRLERPKLASVEMVDRLIIPAFLDCLPPADQRRFKLLVGVGSTLESVEPLESHWPTLPGTPPAPSAELLGETVRRVILRHWAPKPSAVEGAGVE